jgi:DegV family protein with EDD domain
MERLRPVAIVTDGAADLPPLIDLEKMFGIAKEVPIKIVPLEVRIGNKTYKDSVSLMGGINEVTRTNLPKTAAANEEQFYDVYKELVTRDFRVISLHVEGSNEKHKLSGTLDSAIAASRRFDLGQVEIVDTGTVSMAEGLMVIKAAQMASNGLSQQEIVKNLQEIRKRISL